MTKTARFEAIAVGMGRADASEAGFAVFAEVHWSVDLATVSSHWGTHGALIHARIDDGPDAGPWFKPDAGANW